MLWSWLRVARPDDWTGVLARVGLGFLWLIFLLATLIGRMPESWVHAVGDRPWIVRLGVLAVVYVVMRSLGPVIYALLPNTPVLLGRSLYFRRRGQRLRVKLRHIVDVYVEERPPPVEEAFVIELRSGQRLDICPTRWDGAERIYARLRRRARFDLFTPLFAAAGGPRRRRRR